MKSIPEYIRTTDSDQYDDALGPLKDNRIKDFKKTISRRDLCKSQSQAIHSAKEEKFDSWSLSFFFPFMPRV